jgi:hypothetical protein
VTNDLRQLYSDYVVTDQGKRTISLAVFGFGILGGLCGCAIFAPAAFVIGGNDTIPEILALTFAFGTPLPACILALWWRRIAGSWLIFSGCFLFYGLLDQRSWQIYGGSVHELSVWKTILTALPFSCLLVGIGLFGVLTEIWKWPKLLRSRPPSD